MTAFFAWAIRPDIVKAGLVDDGKPAIETEADDACRGVPVTRGLKYGESDQNRLNIASTRDKSSDPRAVLLFIAGNSFGNEGSLADWATRDEAMCLAARHGLIGATMSYRRAPDYGWPAGARDVADAISWIRQNIDLFGGDAQEIIAVGYAVGAFHLASFLAHREFQTVDSDIAGAVLVSGIYSPSAEGDDGERSYFGADPAKYGERSAYPGIVQVEAPIVLAWARTDSARQIAQAEMLNDRLCRAGHCPRVALLLDRATPASLFGPDDSGQSLADRTKQLLSQVEARGLP